MISNKYLYQFLPQEFYYLTKTKTIKYKDINLKTSYLINIIHEIILKFYFTNKNYMDLSPGEDIKFNLWSSILRKKYGMHYNIYMNYLIENDFISLVSDYYVGKKAKTYKINYFDINNVKRIKIEDNILLKKNSKEYIVQSITSYCNSPIDQQIRRRLVEDLFHVKIDYENSINLINELKEKNEIELNKYYKNIHSIESIKNGNLFFKFDEYGRFHSNFTILKREIRQNFLKINNDDITEIDIGNSQPLFLAVLLQKELNADDDEIKKYIWIVKNGLFYEHIIDKCKKNINRKEAKLLTYKVLFGYNGLNSKENKIFKDLFPKIYDYIIEYKNLNNNYKSMSHTLQKMESDFLFDKVVSKIYDKFNDIRIITIHDSILFPIKYKNDIENIFKKEKENLFN